jgi:hypothetical protein
MQLSTIGDLDDSEELPVMYADDVDDDLGGADDDNLDVARVDEALLDLDDDLDTDEKPPAVSSPLTAPKVPKALPTQQISAARSSPALSAPGVAKSPPAVTRKPPSQLAVNSGLKANLEVRTQCSLVLVTSRSQRIGFDRQGSGEEIACTRRAQRCVSG